MRFDERNEIMQLICRYRAAAVILAAGCLLGIFSVINALPPNFDECDWAFAIIDAVPIFLSALLGASIAVAVTYRRRLAAERNGEEPTLVKIDLRGGLIALGVLVVIGAGAAVYNERTGKLGKTLLIFATEAGNPVAVQSLIRLGSNVNVSHNGWTPLMCAADNNDAACVKALIEAKANVLPRNEDGDTALLLVICGNKPSIACVKSLVLAGSDVNMSDTAGITPLTRSAAGGNLSILETVLTTRADINKMGYDNRSAVDYAAQLPTTDCLQFLLSRGSKINSRDGYDETPLMSAAERNSLPCVRYLLSHGADAKAKDSTGKEAIDCAKDDPEFGPIDPEILAILKKAGSH
jgi:ankyrin repeat protein/uncharacterized integral membrane protein